MNRQGYVRNDGPLWRYIDMIDQECNRPYFISGKLGIVLTDDEVYMLDSVDIINKNNLN